MAGSQPKDQGLLPVGPQNPEKLLAVLPPPLKPHP